MKGEISVQTQHIFPVIKRWLYSEKDIFIREIISNACDAITKYNRLVSLAKTEDDGEKREITVKVDKDAQTLTVSDNGIGMSADDVDNYINKIALSGALDFIKKYEQTDSNESNGIIGHFGLGFYSSFMVSDTVELFTKSFDGSEAVHWTCNSDGEYETEPCEREGKGTDVVLHLNEDELSYLDTEKLNTVLKRYCSFMPYPIMLDKGDGKEPEQINDTQPLWQKNPSDITKEQYNEFYKTLFGDYRDPLFYVHINADYPLNFKGILFFPQPKNGYESVEPQVKLYYNQVFVADNIKEIIPDFLVNIKGVVDCPELPLNVSRSYLQTNTYVAKVSAHIVKKVADRINTLFNNEREAFEKIWDDCAPYLRYACIRDGKFYDRVKDSTLLRDTDDKHITLAEYFDGEIKGDVFYATSKDDQAYYIALYRERDKRVLLLDSIIDQQYMSFLEQKNEGVKFVRVDSDVSGALDAEKADADKALEELFTKAIGKESVKVAFSRITGNDIPAFINVSEQSRRFSEMMKAYSPDGNGDFPLEETLTVNLESPMISSIDVSDFEKSLRVAKQAYLLALLASRKLTAEETKELIAINLEAFN